eukprot:4875641-Pyramimonas_sp.AAC.1
MPPSTEVDGGSARKALLVCKACATQLAACSPPKSSVTPMIHNRSLAMSHHSLWFRRIARILYPRAAHLVPNWNK